MNYPDTKNNQFEFPNNITIGLLMYDNLERCYKIVPALLYQQEIYNTWTSNKIEMNQTHFLFESLVSRLSLINDPFIFSVSPRPTKSICEYKTKNGIYWMSNNAEDLYNFKGYATRLTDLP